MKKKSRNLNWHFYNKRFRVQIVVEAVTYAQAKKRLRDAFQWVPPKFLDEYVFEFGERPAAS